MVEREPMNGKLLIKLTKRYVRLARQGPNLWDKIRGYTLANTYQRLIDQLWYLTPKEMQWYIKISRG